MKSQRRENRVAQDRDRTLGSSHGPVIVSRREAMTWEWREGHSRRMVGRVVKDKTQFTENTTKKADPEAHTGEALGWGAAGWQTCPARERPFLVVAFQCES